MRSNYAKLFGSRATQIEGFKKEGFQHLKSKIAPGGELVFKDTEWTNPRTGKTVTKYQLVLWLGKADKPLEHCFFLSAKDRSEKASRYFRNAATREAEKKARTEALKAIKASDHWQEGDVMSYSWGYDQTNVDWFQVISVSKKTIKIRQICCKSSDHGGATGGQTQPDRFNWWKDEVLTKRVGKDGLISFDHGVGRKWDGKAVYTSSYH